MYAVNRPKQDNVFEALPLEIINIIVMQLAPKDTLSFKLINQTFAKLVPLWWSQKLKAEFAEEYQLEKSCAEIHEIQPDYQRAYMGIKFANQKYIENKELFNLVRQGELEQLAGILQVREGDTDELFTIYDGNGYNLLDWLAKLDSQNEFDLSLVGYDDLDKKWLLSDAVDKNLFEVVAYLLKQGLDINDDGFSHLSSAIAKGHIAMVEFLISKGIDTTPLYELASFVSILHKAIDDKNMEVIEFLSRYDVYLYRALKVAIDDESLELVKYLVNLGADIHKEIKDEEYDEIHPVFIFSFLYSENEDINIFLLDCIEDFTEIKNTKYKEIDFLLNAFEKKQFNLALKFIERGLKTDCLNKDAKILKNIVESAMDKKHKKFISWVLENTNIDLNKKYKINRKETSLLIWAIDNEYKNLIRVLIKKGVNVNHAVEDDFLMITPLLAAIKKGKLEIIKHLLEEDENIKNFPNSSLDDMFFVYPPLILAIELENFEIAKYLIDNEFDVSIDNDDYLLKNPLEMCIEIGNMELVKMLVEKGKKIKIENYSSIHICSQLIRNIESGGKEYICYFLHKNVIRKSDYSFLLQAALEFSSEESFKILVENDVDINTPIALESKALTPLETAIDECKIELAIFLINTFDINVNRQFSYGENQSYNVIMLAIDLLNSDDIPYQCTHKAEEYKVMLSKLIDGIIDKLNINNQFKEFMLNHASLSQIKLLAEQGNIELWDYMNENGILALEIACKNRSYDLVEYIVAQYIRENRMDELTEQLIQQRDSLSKYSTISELNAWLLLHDDTSSNLQESLLEQLFNSNYLQELLWNAESIVEKEDINLEIISEDRMCIVHYLMDNFSLPQQLLPYIAKNEIYQSFFSSTLKASKELNTPDKHGNTALHYAVKFGHIDWVEALISKNANIHNKNLQGFSAFDYAYILHQFAQVHGEQNAVFTAMIDFENINMKTQQEAFLNKINDLENIDISLLEFDPTEIHSYLCGFVEKANFPMVKLLVEGLGISVMHGREDVVENIVTITLLQDDSIYKKAYRDDYWSSLDAACQNSALLKAVLIGNLEMVDYLITQGADVNAPDVYLGLALVRAIEQRNLDMVTLLLNHGATVHIPELKLRSPMVSAIECGNGAITNTLWAQCSDTDRLEIRLLDYQDKRLFDIREVKGITLFGMEIALKPDVTIFGFKPFTRQEKLAAVEAALDKLEEVRYDDEPLNTFYAWLNEPEKADKEFSLGDERVLITGERIHKALQQTSSDLQTIIAEFDPARVSNYIRQV